MGAETMRLLLLTTTGAGPSPLRRGDIWHVGQIWSGHNSGVLYFNEGTETGKSTPFGPNQHFFCNDCRITGFHMN
ncbi:hypothetical protein [Streptomyces noursei]|uniref:hypothetical protein n=1 Tax=Streptomyces noursei TaxID=1971 RepID=UPI003826EBF9